MSRAVKSGILLAATHHSSFPRYNSSVLCPESLLGTSYAVQSLLQTPDIELQVVWHYPVLTEMNGFSVRCDMYSDYLVFIPLCRQDAIPGNMQVLLSDYADSAPYHQFTLSVVLFVRTSGCIQCLFPFLTEHSVCHTPY